MGPVVSLVKEGENPSFDRCYDVAQHFVRVGRIHKKEPYVKHEDESIISMFQSLYNKHRLLIRKNNDGTFEVFHLPSAQACLSVFKKGDTHGWPMNIHNRQKKVFRVTKGAIIKCPLEDGNGFLDVFTTDWAPCASACAVAIHPQHPMVGYWTHCDGDFTGKFVRHPLTGDLIPVHVAGWVKPDFGTGAVLINPGHDEADLKYAREIGLPIRFSIAPKSFDGTPSTWPKPPVKAGNAVKTGFYDGKPQKELIQIYFNKLKEFGLAEYHYDCQAGIWPIGRLLRVGSEATHSDFSLTLDLSHQNTHLQRNTVEPYRLLSTLASIPKKSKPIIITPASEIEKQLLGLRLAYYDAAEEPLIPERIEVVQKVNDSGLDRRIYFRQAALVGAKINEVSTPKKQLIEKVERFNVQHEKINRINSLDIEEIHSTSLWRLAVQTLQSFYSDGYSRAFSNLYKLQKELRRVEFERLPFEPGFQAYLVITYIIMGIGDIDQGFDALRIYEKLTG